MKGNSPSTLLSLRISWWSLACIFAAVLFLGEITARIAGPELPVVPESETDEKIEQLLALEDKGRQRILLVGASDSLAAIDPFRLEHPKIGSSFYHAGLKGLTFDQYRRWLEDLVLPRVEPKGLVLSISPVILYDDSELEVEVTKATGRDLFALTLDRAEPKNVVESFLENNSAFWRRRDQFRAPGTVLTALHNRLLGSDARPTEVPVPGSDSVERSGTTYRFLEAKPAGEIKRLARSGAEEFRSEGYNLNIDDTDMKEFVEWISSLGIPLVFYIPPATPYMRLTFEDRWDEMAERTVNLIDPYAAVVDLSDVEIGDDSYHDPSHVAAEGRRAITEALRQRLVSLCVGGDLTTMC